MSTGPTATATGLVLVLAVAAALAARAHLSWGANSSVDDTTAAAQLREWRSKLFLRTVELQTATERQLGRQVDPLGHAQFSLFEPFVQCPGGEVVARYGGDGDGGKLLCPSMLAKGCVVYSLGSAGDDSFEADILNRTTCEVVTFDCTTPGRSTHPRHRYVQKCLGTKQRMQADPAVWITLDAAMAEYGHEQLALLKADIEGSEFDVLAFWQLGAAKLPNQISVELHTDWLYHGTSSMRNPNDFSNLWWPMHKVSLAELSLFVGHLSNLGYAVVSKENNAVCPHCCELTLRKVLL